MRPLKKKEKGTMLQQLYEVQISYGVNTLKKPSLMQQTIHILPVDAGLFMYELIYLALDSRFNTRAVEMTLLFSIIFVSRKFVLQTLDCFAMV